MSAISSTLGITSQTVRQLFGSATQAPTPDHANNVNDPARKIQELATRKFHIAKEWLRLVDIDPVPNLIGDASRSDVGASRLRFIERQLDMFELQARFLNSGLAGPMSMEPNDEEVPDGAMLAHIDLEGFRQGWIARFASNLQSFLGAAPPVDTMADGGQRIGQIDMLKVVPYGPGDNDAYTVRIVGGAGEAFQYTIIDHSTGKESRYVPTVPSYSEGRGGMVNTKA